eukprot:m.75430 g.75430  ORF g.75430 m.75430 type:complete len:250 (+) comp12451_c0_seq2:388-1137(+)
MVYSLRSRGKRTVAAEDAAAQQPRRKRSSSLAPTKATRGKSSKTAASDVNVCTHINSSKLSILSAKTREAILDPCNWTCSECATTHNVWACLHCPHFACGRLQNCHAETHFKSSNHPLVIDVCNLSVHCYLCEEWVILDNMDQQIESLRDAMKTVQEQHVDESHTRSGRLLRCGSSVEAHESYTRTTVRYLHLHIHRCADIPFVHFIHLLLDTCSHERLSFSGWIVWTLLFEGGSSVNSTNCLMHGACL